MLERWKSLRSASFPRRQAAWIQRQLSNLERLLGAWRRAEKPANSDPSSGAFSTGPVRDPDNGHAISPVIAAALCIKPRGLLTRQQAGRVDALKQGSHEFDTMRSLAMRFNGILRGGRSEPLDAWIEDAIDTELIPIERFARVLRRDIDAVYNAIELPWSNGPTEGQINRLKTLKRAMYGRAGTELIRARCYRFATQSDGVERPFEAA